MASNAEIEIRRKRTAREANTGFRHGLESAPFASRCGALIFDYVLIVLIPVVFLLVGRIMGNDSSELLKSEWNNLGWLLAVMATAANFLLLPAITGQTLGKMFASIRVVRTDGGEVSLRAILLRQIVGGIFTVLSLGGLFIVAVFHPRGRALHDILAGTIVVSRNRQIRF